MGLLGLIIIGLCIELSRPDCCIDSEISRPLKRSPGFSLEHWFERFASDEFTSEISYALAVYIKVSNLISLNSKVKR